jgi:glycosyltransferase involved in cell wall biosynthesis
VCSSDLKLLPVGGRIVVVDDGSTDGGAETLDCGNVTMIRHPFNLGQGAALRTGFEYALLHGADYVATFDSDGQYLPSDLPWMQEHLIENDLDIVTGSRFLGRTVDMPMLRRLLVRSSRWLARAIYGVRLTDTQNGVRMMNRRAAEKLLFTQNRMAHAMEAHARVVRFKLRHAEYPNTMVYTQYSRSKGQGNIRGSLRILYDLFMPMLFRKRTLALERQVTVLARRQAIQDAVEPTEHGRVGRSQSIGKSWPDDVDSSSETRLKQVEAEGG